MHPLTILATGLYGEELPNQNGAPLRLVVPWKYGFNVDQGHREDDVDGRGAAHDLEHAESARVRVLFERQPRGEPSTVVAGFGSVRSERDSLPDASRH